MKVLIFAGGFFPGKTFGGPPVSVDNFCSLMKEFDCYIVTSDHDNKSKARYSNIEVGWNNRGNAKVLYLSDREYFSVNRLNAIVKEIEPDVLYLQSLFQDLTLLGLIVAKKNGIKVLLAPRGELCSGAFKKKYKKLPYLLFLRKSGLLNRVEYQSTSDEETEEICTYLRTSIDKVHFLTNIPSIPKNTFTRPEKIPGKANGVFLSRIHPKKNLDFALNCLMNIRGEVFFDIYGPIEDISYWEKCQEIIRQLPTNIVVSYRGIVGHEVVHEIFSQYDFFFFPTLSENYGHVIAEALIVGCPVIISNNTPWNDVDCFEAGWAISLSDSATYSSSIQKMVDLSHNDWIRLSTNAKLMANNKSNLNVLHEKYLAVFNQL